MSFRAHLVETKADCGSFFLYVQETRQPQLGKYPTVNTFGFLFFGQQCHLLNWD